MKKNQLQLLTAYGVAVVLCLGSYRFLLRLEGSRGSLLALVMFVVSHFLEWSLQGAARVSVLLASLVVSLPFVVDAYLLQRRTRVSRIVGLALLAILLFATLFWGWTSAALYDPTPGLER
jgi:MFS superfamily sulfate permease-like transporter